MKGRLDGVYTHRCVAEWSDRELLHRANVSRTRLPETRAACREALRETYGTWERKQVERMMDELERLPQGERKAYLHQCKGEP